MDLSAQDVKKIARLARIRLSESEETLTLEALNRVFALIETMQTINTDEVEPLSHPHEFAQFLREDEVTEINQREAYQKVAPAVAQGLYLVPKVIE